MSEDLEILTKEVRCPHEDSLYPGSNLATIKSQTSLRAQTCYYLERAHQARPPRHEAKYLPHLTWPTCNAALQLTVHPTSTHESR